MPDEDKTMIEVDETGTDESSKGGGFPIKKYGIYAGIVVVVIVAAYFVTLKVVKPMLAGGGSSETTEEVAEDSKPDEKHGEEKPKKEHKSSDEGDSGHGSGGEVTAESVFMIRDIIVNPAGTGGTRFLSASVGFEMVNSEQSALMAAKEPIIRDALVTILSSQSIPELSDYKQRERLRKLIRLRVKRLLKADDLGAVYFTEFVLQ